MFLDAVITGCPANLYIPGSVYGGGWKGHGLRKSFEDIKTVGVDLSTPTGTLGDVGLGAPLGGRPLEAAKDLEPGATY